MCCCASVCECKCMLKKRTEAKQRSREDAAMDLDLGGRRGRAILRGVFYVHHLIPEYLHLCRRRRTDRNGTTRPRTIMGCYPVEHFGLKPDCSAVCD